MQKKKKILSGFTLLEMAVVMIVVGIISSVAVVKYMSTIEKLRAKEGEEILIALTGAEKRYAQENGGSYTMVISNLDIELRTSAYFGSPVAVAGPPVAIHITRTGSYTLRIIIQNGVIDCFGGPAGLCSKLGY